MPRWKQTCLGAFPGSKFCWGKKDNKPPSPSHNSQESGGAKEQGRELGKVQEFSLQDSLYTPHPQLTGSPSLLPLTLPPFLPFRPPLPSRLSSFSQQPSPQSALPDPISLPPSPPLPPFLPPPQWGGGPKKVAPSPARLRQRW